MLSNAEASATGFSPGYPLAYNVFMKTAAGVFFKQLAEVIPVYKELLFKQRSERSPSKLLSM